MLLNRILLVVTVFLLQACSAHIYLYPVSGGASKQRPLPIISGTVSSAKPAVISLVLPTGQSCEGTWSRMTPADNAMIDTSQPSEAVVAADWDRVYGKGYYLANVKGKERGISVVKDSKGSNIHLDFFYGKLTPSIKGVAKDSNGNLYVVTRAKVEFTYANTSQ